MTTSAEKPTGIVAALVAFQAALPHIGRTAQAQYGKYADLADVSGAILPRLAQNGLAYVCELDIADDGRLLLNCSLRHTSGETFQGFWPIAPAGPQQMGSAITYGRRYMLLALTGVHPEGEDDDGSAAQEYGQTKKATRSKGKQPDDEWTTPPPDPEPEPEPERTDRVTDPQRRMIFAMLHSLGISTDDERRRVVSALVGRQLASFNEITRSDGTLVIDGLKELQDSPDSREAVRVLAGQGVL